MLCKKCGTDIYENQFCPKCGASAEESPVSPSQSEKTTLNENIAGLLCYVLGWITGIVFIIIDKRPYVRFHAIQSTITFAAISVVTIILGKLIYFFPYSLWRIFSGINSIIGLCSLALGIFLAMHAYKGIRYKLPMIGDTAERMISKMD